MDYTSKIQEYFEREKRTIDAINMADLSQVMNVLEQAREEGRQIFIMGNAADNPL